MTVSDWFSVFVLHWSKEWSGGWGVTQHSVKLRSSTNRTLPSGNESITFWVVMQLRQRILNEENQQKVIQ